MTYFVDDFRVRFASHDRPPTAHGSTSDRNLTSNLVTRIAHFELELPSFKRHQHASKFVPLDAATINDDAWPMRILITVPFDSAADGFVYDLQSEIAVFYVGDRE